MPLCQHQTDVGVRIFPNMAAGGYVPFGMGGHWFLSSGDLALDILCSLIYNIFNKDSI